MEPKQPIRRAGPEFSPSQPISPESWQASAPEQLGDRSHEEQPQPGKAAGENELPIPVLPVPPVGSDGVSDDNAATVPTDDNPLAASDDDVIEKEWVDRAKKIIGDTKGDPYRREYEVGRLQADYLKKRYGKELGKAGENG